MSDVTLSAMSMAERAFRARDEAREHRAALLRALGRAADFLLVEGYDIEARVANETLARVYKEMSTPTTPARREGT